MRIWTRVAAVMIVGLLATMGLHARPGGGPGGHGGSGGHGGRGAFSSGRSSGPSSGRGVGHAIGHSFGRLFGRPKEPDMAPIAGAAFVHGKVVRLPGPESCLHLHSVNSLTGLDSDLAGARASIFRATAS